MCSRKSKFIVLLILFISVFSISSYSAGSIENEYLIPILNEIFETRNGAILVNDVDTVKDLYDVTLRNGQWAFEHEVKKIKYLSNWSDKQGIVFKDINSKIVIKWTRMKENGNMVVNFLASSSYKYVYEDRVDTENMMRIGTHHEIELTQKDGSWHITREWYTDPFADSLAQNNLKAEKNKELILSNNARNFSNLNKRRIAAVMYADKHCGSASNGENGYGYNPKYRNYNPLGGDCANFASQILHEGGKFRKNSAWNYDKDGSMSWISAQGLKNYLIASGRGSLIVSGSYNNVLKLSYRLLPGDIVAYEKKGIIKHISVVTGADSRGYALVNCHNTDRYRVPWDLGWSDSGIRFHLIRVNY